MALFVDGTSGSPPVALAESEPYLGSHLFPRVLSALLLSLVTSSTTSMLSVLSLFAFLFFQYDQISSISNTSYGFCFSDLALSGAQSDPQW